MQPTNLRGIVRYHGAKFAGWQIQQNAVTVQGALEAALAQIAQAPVGVHGAGRTDAGVHALGQVFSFRWPKEPDCASLERALNGMLSPDVRVSDVRVAAPEFHPRKSAIAKHYCYALEVGKFPDPFTADFAWLISPNVDLEVVRMLAARLAGEHDFAGFQCSGATVRSTVRTLHSLTLCPGGFVCPEAREGVYWRLDFRGDGFLYKMIRNITGTLIDIARGQLPEAALHERLSLPGPYRGYTAPAHGLALMSVDY